MRISFSVGLNSQLVLVFAVLPSWQLEDGFCGAKTTL